jgi:aminoglycoside 2''-phosphotransferase
MEEAEAFVKRIRQVYPDIEPLDVQIIHGQSPVEDAVLLDDELVFRFPRTEADIEPLRREVASLRSLQGRLPLPVPSPEYASLEPGQAFIGFRRMPGVQLSMRLRQDTLPGHVFERIVIQMANFMHALHEVPLDALEIEIPTAETRTAVAGFAEDVRTELAPAMRPDAADWVDRLFKPFLANPDNFAFKPVVRHGSLTGNNIFIDPHTGAVTGVTGFSTLALGDPAVDVAGLGTISEAFFSELYRVDQDEIGRLLWRAQFYKSTFALQEALAGARLGDPEAYRRGMAPYQPRPAGSRVEDPSQRTS